MTALAQQECIPVRCVLPASVAVLWGGGMLVQGVSTKGVCLGGIACWDTPPPVNRMTYRL